MASNASLRWGALPDGASSANCSPSWQLASSTPATWPTCGLTTRRRLPHAHAQPSDTNRPLGNTGDRPLLALPRAPPGSSRSQEKPRQSLGPPYQGAQAPVSRAGPGRAAATGPHGVSRRADHDDHDALSAQPAPHGPLFAWLDQEGTSMAPAGWAVRCSEICAAEAHEAWHCATGMKQARHAQPDGAPEIRRELRGVLNRMGMEWISSRKLRLWPPCVPTPGRRRLRALQSTPGAGGPERWRARPRLPGRNFETV